LEAGPDISPRLLRPRLSVIREVSEESSRTSTPSLSPSRKLSTQSSQSSVLRKLSNQSGSQPAFSKVSSQQQDSQSAVRTVSTQQQDSRRAARTERTQVPTQLQTVLPTNERGASRQARQSADTSGHARQVSQSENSKASARVTAGSGKNDKHWWKEEKADSLQNKENLFQESVGHVRRRDKKSSFKFEDERAGQGHQSGKVASEEGRGRRRRTVRPPWDSSVELPPLGAAGENRRSPSPAKGEIRRSPSPAKDEKMAGGGGRPGSRVQFNNDVTIQSLPPVFHQQPTHRNSRSKLT
jgi:hypothetical protein